MTYEALEIMTNEREIKQSVLGREGEPGNKKYPEIYQDHSEPWACFETWLKGIQRSMPFISTM